MEPKDFGFDFARWNVATLTAHASANHIVVPFAGTKSLKGDFVLACEKHYINLRSQESSHPPETKSLSTDPRILTAAKLRQILIAHNIPYGIKPTKASLIATFNGHLPHMLASQPLNPDQAHTASPPAAALFSSDPALQQALCSPTPTTHPLVSTTPLQTPTTHLSAAIHHLPVAHDPTPEAPTKALAIYRSPSTPPPLPRSPPSTPFSSGITSSCSTFSYSRGLSSPFRPTKLFYGNEAPSTRPRRSFAGIPARGRCFPTVDLQNSDPAAHCHGPRATIAHRTSRTLRRVQKVVNNVWITWKAITEEMQEGDIEGVIAGLRELVVDLQEDLEEIEGVVR